MSGSSALTVQPVASAAALLFTNTNKSAAPVLTLHMLINPLKARNNPGNRRLYLCPRRRANIPPINPPGTENSVGSVNARAQYIQHFRIVRYN